MKGFDELMGFPERDLSGIPDAVNDTECPGCGNETPEDPYVADGKEWPECFNESYTHTDLGKTHDWDEVHRCPVCGRIYRIRTGCY